MVPGDHPPYVDLKASHTDHYFIFYILYLSILCHTAVTASGLPILTDIYQNII